MGAQLYKHNNKILRNSFGKNSAPPSPKCNCIQSKIRECPSQGHLTYIGLASKFKSRYYKHKASLENFTSENSTTLSTQYWEEKNHGNQPVVSWKILERNISIFNPVVQKCNLFTREKFNTQLCSLNLRKEPD